MKKLTLTRKRPMKKRRGYANKAKQDAWEAFSTFIRVRDSIQTTGTITACLCVTCGRVTRMGPTLHAGHWQAGRGNGALFDERGCHGQCSTCNTSGAIECAKNYNQYMRTRYSPQTLDDIRRRAHSVMRVTDAQFEQICNTYKQKTQVMINSVRPEQSNIPQASTTADQSDGIATGGNARERSHGGPESVGNGGDYAA